MHVWINEVTMGRRGNWDLDIGSGFAHVGDGGSLAWDMQWSK